MGGPPRAPGRVGIVGTRTSLFGHSRQYGKKQAACSFAGVKAQ
jgi:hypothetical protein